MAGSESLVERLMQAVQGGKGLEANLRGLISRLRLALASDRRDNRPIRDR